MVKRPLGDALRWNLLWLCGLDSVLSGDKEEIPVADRSISRGRLNTHYGNSKVAKYLGFVCTDTIYIGKISAAERSEAAEPKTAPRLVRGLAGGAAGGKKNHAIWLHFPPKSGNIDYRIVE